MSFIFGQAPDPKGNWKLSGLSVDYLHIARETTPFLLTVDYPGTGTSFSSSSDCAIRVDENGDPTGDDSGTLVVNPNPNSICFHLLDVPAGVMFNRLTNGPFTNTGLAGIGVNLNVNIYDNGYGTIAQGSFYPDIELSESQDCVTDLQIFAVDENFTWEIGTEELRFSNSNVLGMENGLLCVGDDPDTVEIECTNDADGDGMNDDAAWGFGLVTGLFDATPSTPVPVRMPPVLDALALSATEVLGLSCGAWCCGPSGPTGSDGDGVNACSDGAGALAFNGDVAGCTAACSGWDYDTAAQYGASTGNVPGWIENGTGTSSVFNTNTGASTMCTDNAGNSVPGDGNCNPNVDFRLVWNALDSAETGLGFGDDETDEDGDGTDYDRIFGVPYISGTTLNTSNPLCDITGGTAKYLTPGTPAYGDERYNFNYGLAGDIVSTIGDAGCGETYDVTDADTYCCSSGDHPFYLNPAHSAESVSSVYACGEASVAGFITGNCNANVVSTVTGMCEAADGDDDATTNNGTPTLFATGFCDQQVNANIAGCTTVGWEGIVSGVCSGLGVDCAPFMGSVQGIFDSVCAGIAASTAGGDADISGLGITTCAELASTTAQDLSDLECEILDTGVVPDGNGGTIDFSLGACASVVGPIIGALDSNDDNVADTCSEWVGSFEQAAIDGFSSASLGDGVTCTSYGADFTSDCLETADEPNSENLTEMYLLNPSAVPAQYGFFATYNGVTLTALATQAATPDMATGGLSPIPCGDGFASFDMANLTADLDTNTALITGFTLECNPLLGVNDSDHDFDPSCLGDDDVVCSGRLRTVFEPTCVREIEARQIVAEFVDLTAACQGLPGDVDYSCAAYDWNYNYQADCNSDVDGNPGCITETGNGDGAVTEAECSAFAAATGQAFQVNGGLVQPSCDAEEGITSNCTELSATVVWNAAYNMCGDGDPNDLIDLGVNGFCGPAVNAGAFDDAATDPEGALGCPTGDFVLPNGATCAEAACAGFYAQQGGVPSFEQSCTVGNGTVSVTDVVRIINHIIGNDSTGGESVDQLGGEAACAADVNSDGNINVVDVVAVVNGILADQGGRVADASEASIIIDNDRIVVDADGYIGAVDMIVEFTDNFSFELADGFASNYNVNGNIAHIILVGDRNGISEVLTMTSGKIVDIQEALVVNSSDFITTSINQPSLFSVGAAYPNPFNPSTNISLVLNANADLSVKVYNLTGQLVDVIAEGNYSPSTYNWTWKAENLASGVYFIKAQVGSDVNTQKVMLLK